MQRSKIDTMSFPRLSDVGSDREADSSLDLSRLFNAMDRSQVSTPRKVGTLPFVPRLDKPDQAVPMVEDSATAEKSFPHPARQLPGSTLLRRHRSRRHGLQSYRIHAGASVTKLFKLQEFSLSIIPSLRIGY